jgi:hypothetical protein
MAPVYKDYRRTVALKYVKRGFTYIIAYVPSIVAIALAAFASLEMLNLLQQGELKKLWNVARQTELTLDLVREEGGVLSVCRHHVIKFACCHLRQPT